MWRQVVLLLWAVCWWDPAVGHVALTFPPARQYDLDFLDSTRTRPPCGMPKGKSVFLRGACAVGGRSLSLVPALSWFIQLTAYRGE